MAIKPARENNCSMGKSTFGATRRSVFQLAPDSEGPLALEPPHGFLTAIVRGSRRIRSNRLSKRPFGKLAPLRVTHVLALWWGQMIGMLLCPLGQDCTLLIPGCNFARPR